MVKNKKQRKPYSKRSDIKKITSNWTKAPALYNRKDFSAAIVRAATAVEIAANLVIREELQAQRKLEEKFVHSLLIWANGLDRKYNELILPITKGSKKYEKFKAAQSTIQDINKERNSVIHRGQFKKQSTARKIIDLSKDIIEMFVKQYRADFTLE